MQPLVVSSLRLLLPIVFLGAQPAIAASETGDEIDELRLLLKIQQEQIEALQEAVRSQQVTLEAQHKLLAAVRERPAPPSPAEQPVAADEPAVRVPADEPPEITPKIVQKTATDEPDSVVKASTALTATADYDQDEDEPAAETGETTESEASEAVVAASTALTGSAVRADDQDTRADETPERTGATEDDASFAGSWPLPDTNARLRIGGYVKLAIVDNFDPLLTDDRFIVGGIPSDDARTGLGAEEDVTLSVSQSRLNLELRDKSPLGDLRAFVEGDFASTNDTFRLRHAFGQFRRMLAGKTWSTLMDLKSRPEEVDFEGINGRINVRQAQLRFFPKISERLDVSVSFEDPSPDVSGGTGISQLPDIVIGADSFGWRNGLLERLNSRPGWNARLALLLRNISARNGALGKKESATGWGITASGSVATPFWSENDQFLWQLTYGDGVGRYINDLGTIGGQDAIFSPSGNLQTWPVFAGYVSYQHWWRSRWRSNLTFSWVKLDAYDFQSSASYVDDFGDPYERTLRASINLLYNPIPRVELGAEFLWGERKNANDTKGDATQLQLSAKYGF